MAETRTIQTHGPDETQSVARALARELRPGDRLFLRGDLGGGKTTFTRGLVEGLDHPDPREVASPTYALHHVYEGGRIRVDHLDLYRTDGGSELARQGLLDAFGIPDNLVIVEWSERMGDGFTASLLVTFTFVDEETRTITFEACSPRGVALVTRLREVVP